MSLTRRGFVLRSSASFFAAGFTHALFADEPAKVEFPGMITRMSEPENLEFPFAALKTPITPAEQFYVRNHFPIPKIDIDKWRLTVEGAVKQPLSLTYNELLKMKSSKLTATLECAGNGRVYLTPPANGVQWSQGAIGNAEWIGVPLAAILDKAGLKESAVEVILEGSDKGQINSDPKSPGAIHFARSLPIGKAKDPAVLLAYKMNGADLSTSHGFPLVLSSAAGTVWLRSNGCRESS